MKLNKILTAMLFLATLVGCGGVGTSSQPNSQSNSNEVGSSINSQGSTTEFSSATSEVNKVENKVKIKSIDVVDEEQKIKNARRMSSGNESSEETSNDIITSSEEIVSSSSENSETSSEETPSIDDINMNKNWVLIYKSQTDITFTVTLDDPRHLGIDALIITCDDPESQIKVGDTYKPIQMEADGTRMVDWGDDPYEQTYHIRTTSPDAVNSFKVLDVRITNHEKFQSEETDNRDLGNNELKIYKMDDDAIKLNVVENTFEYVKFNYVIKEGYEELISNVVVEGLTPDEDGYYIVEEDEKEITAKYEYTVNEKIKASKFLNDSIGRYIFEGIEYDPNSSNEYKLELMNTIFDHHCNAFSISRPYPNRFNLNFMITCCGIGVIPDKIEYNGKYFENISILSNEELCSVYICDISGTDLPYTHEEYNEPWISYVNYLDLSKYLDKFYIYLNSNRYKLLYTKIIAQDENGQERSMCIFSGIELLEE